MNIAQQQLDRFLQLLAGGGPTSDDIEEMFGPELLAAMPAAAFVDLFTRELRVTNPVPRTTAVRGEHEVVVAVELQNGSAIRLEARTAEQPPYRFVAFDAAPAPTLGACRLRREQLADAEPVPSTATELPNALSARLEQLVAEHRQRHRTPGLIALVADRDARVLWCRTEGVGDLADLRAPSLAMTVRIGSVSKTMTALAVMQLVESGQVELDAPASSYLSSVVLSGLYGKDVTVRHLLTHTSGLRPRASIDLGVDEGGAVPSLADFYADGMPNDIAPGESWAYSNDGFALLGQMVEDVAGQAFSDYAAERVFDALGMSHTSYRRDGRVTEPLFEGIDVELDEVVQAPYREVIPEGAGSVFSTPQDMARYGAAVLGLGGNAHGRALGAATFSQMLQPQPAAEPAPGLRMGLGWVLGEAGGAPLYWHNGGWPGANSEMAVLPQHGQTVLVFANTLGGGLDGLCFELIGELAASGG